MIKRSSYIIIEHERRWWASNKKMGGAMFEGNSREEALQNARKHYELYKRLGEDEYYARDIFSKLR